MCVLSVSLSLFVCLSVCVSVFHSLCPPPIALFVKCDTIPVVFMCNTLSLGLQVEKPSFYHPSERRKQPIAALMFA